MESVLYMHIVDVRNSGVFVNKGSTAQLFLLKDFHQSQRILADVQ